LNAARESARCVSCLSNQRHLLIALKDYAEDQIYFPPCGWPIYYYWDNPWFKILRTSRYLPNLWVVKCPSLKNAGNPESLGNLRVGIGARFSQGYPAVVWDSAGCAGSLRVHEQEGGPMKILVGDSMRVGDDYSFVIQGPNEFSPRHGRKGNFGFLGGHVGTYAWEPVFNGVLPPGAIW